MPSGRVHDRITLWLLPAVTLAALAATRRSDIALLVAGSFLFGGLMFGPDLDIHSVQYKRWGILRWIWLPYQKSIRHRSHLSHGFLVGTIARSLYFALVLAAFLGIGLAIAGLRAENWQAFVSSKIAGTSALVGRSLQKYPIEWAAFFIGLELGAMSHAASDEIDSAFKRFKSRGWRAFAPKKEKKRKRKRR